MRGPSTSPAVSKGEGGETQGALEAALGHAVPGEVGEWLDARGPEQSPGDARLGLVPRAGFRGAEEGRVASRAPEAGGAPSHGNGTVWAGCIRRPSVGVAASTPTRCVRGAPVQSRNGGARAKAGRVARGLRRARVDGRRRQEDSGRSQGVRRARQALAKRPKHLTPNALFTRAYWLLGLLAGEPAFRFAEHLLEGLAAFGVEEGESEAAQGARAGSLLDAHALSQRGRQAACKQAVALSKKAKGYVVVEIPRRRSKPSLPARSYPRLTPGRRRISRNSARSSRRTRASRTLATPTPSTTDALEVLAKRDPPKAKIIAEYLRERTGEAYNDWPYRAKARRLARAGSAAGGARASAWTSGTPRRSPG